MSEPIYLCGVDSDHAERSPDWVCEECVRIGTLVDAAEQRGYERGKEDSAALLRACERMRHELKSMRRTFTFSEMVQTTLKGMTHELEEAIALCKEKKK